MVDRRMLAAVVMVIVVIVSGLATVLLFGHGSKGGTATEDHRTARAWVDLGAIPSGEVRDEDRWGTVETFSGAATGTLSYYRQASFHQTSATESVVLDGEVWCMLLGRCRADQNEPHCQTLTLPPH